MKIQSQILCASALFLLLIGAACSLPAAMLTLHAPGTNDIYNFSGADHDGANLCNGAAYADGRANDAFTYVAGDRAGQGQTFTTGGNTNGYLVNAIWVRHVG